MTNVILHTNFGDITIEVDEAKTPITAKNFLNYVKRGFYDNTIFHRLINGFVIQGGGFTTDMQEKETEAAIINEAEHGQLNKAYTVAMARTSDPNSATSQFFINLKDNDFLDFKSKTLNGYGYCAFGKVVAGMDTIKDIAKVKTVNRGGHQDVPENNLILEKAVVVSAETKSAIN